MELNGKVKIILFPCVHEFFSSFPVLAGCILPQC